MKNGSHNQEKMIQIVKNGILRKFPLLGATMSNLTFEPSTAVQTAGTDGEKVLYNEKFVEGLSFDEKVFLFSHEIMHVAFDHIMRSKGRDHKLWNQATDAVINQMLQAENLPMIEGGVDIKEALNKSAEEMYEKLKLQKEQQSQNGQNGEQQEGEQNEQQGQNGDSENQQAGHDQHDMWEDAIKKAEQKLQEGGQSQGQDDKNQDQENQRGQGSGDSQQEQSEQNSKSSQSSSQQSKQSNSSENNNSKPNSSQAEKQFTQANRDLKEQIGKRIREKLRQQKQDIQENGAGRGGYTSQFENIGESKAVLSWKKILRRELEKEEDRWSYRRADEDNDYQARIGTLEVEDYPETEVMLDVSGSVDDDFLKDFLRQLKPLLKESKLRVGCFDEYVYPFVDIKSAKDIDHFTVTRKSTWTENWDAAIRAFSKKRGINKIIFTDGVPAPGVMPKDDLSKEKIIWLVFRNRNFNPCCGKVIQISERDFQNFSLRSKETCEDELTM